MSRKTVVTSSLVLAVVLALAVPAVYVIFWSPSAVSASEQTVAADSSTFGRVVPNDAFGVGEKLVFDINYGFINAGEASMEVAKLIDWQGRPAYQIISRAVSNKFFSTFFRVEDRVESITDAEGLFPWRFEKTLEEGDFRAHRVHLFDQVKNTVKDNDSVFQVPPYVQDALSSLYWVRTQPLEPGKSLFLDNFVDGKKFHMEVKVHKRESITVPAGTFECIVVEPITQSVGVFKHEGSLKVWLTDDRLRMPVLMKSKVVVGSIAAELKEYKLGEIE